MDHSLQPPQHDLQSSHWISLQPFSALVVCSWLSTLYRSLAKISKTRSNNEMLAFLEGH
jgi:hypothetical protein